MPKNKRGSLGPTSKVQQVELYLWNQILRLEHAWGYLKGNPLLRIDTTHTCLGNWYNQLNTEFKCMILNHVIMSWSQAHEKQPSQRALRSLLAWFEAPTNEEDESKVHCPLSQAPRI
jgi:hypothetical protein